MDLSDTWKEDDAEDFRDNIDIALMHLLFEGKIEMSVDDNGEFVFWMNDTQIAEFDRREADELGME
jgi:phage gp36-like protein